MNLGHYVGRGLLASVSLQSSSSAVSDSEDGSASAGSETTVREGDVNVEAHASSLVRPYDTNHHSFLLSH